jgi:hypothetical protein
MGELQLQTLAEENRISDAIKCVVLQARKRIQSVATMVTTSSEYQRWIRDSITVLNELIEEKK